MGRGIAWHRVEQVTSSSFSLSSLQSLLHLAAGITHLPELGNLLLEAGAAVEAQDRAGRTPLFVACQKNNVYFASRLLQEGEHTLLAGLR